jgi:hypothetical protein
MPDGVVPPRDFNVHRLVDVERLHLEVGFIGRGRHRDGVEDQVVLVLVRQRAHYGERLVIWLIRVERLNFPDSVYDVVGHVAQAVPDDLLPVVRFIDIDRKLKSSVRRRHASAREVLHDVIERRAQIVNEFTEEDPEAQRRRLDRLDQGLQAGRAFGLHNLIGVRLTGVVRGDLILDGGEQFTARSSFARNRSEGFIAPHLPRTPGLTVALLA